MGVTDGWFPHRENCLMEPQTTCPALMTWRTPTLVCPERRSRKQKAACMHVTYVTRHSRRAVPCCDTNTSTQVGWPRVPRRGLRSMLCSSQSFGSTLVQWIVWQMERLSTGQKEHLLLSSKYCLILVNSYCLVKSCWMWWGDLAGAMQCVMLSTVAMVALSFLQDKPSSNKAGPSTRKELQLGQHKVWHRNEGSQYISCFLDIVWPCTI